MVEKLFPDSFLKNQNWALSLDQYSKSFTRFIYIVFQVEDNRKWLKLSCWPLPFISYKTLLKNKKRSGTSLLTLFSAWFLKKNIVRFHYLTIFQWLVAFTSWDIGRYVHCNCLLTRCNVMNFEINLTFLNKPFFNMTKKLWQTFKYLENEKSF